MTMRRHQRLADPAAARNRPVVVVDPTGELARLLLRQRDRGAKLGECARGAPNFRAAPLWLDGFAAWRIETTRILSEWFDREVVAEFALATSTGDGSDRLAKRVSSARTALRNGTELIRALHSTQTACRRAVKPAESVPLVASELSDPRQIAS